jgi:solute:Na+ symporter, SSS family
MGTHAAIACGLVLYAALMLAVSLFWMRRVRRPADYLVGGRSLPFWALTGNITAGCIGTGVIIGASGLAYRHGWAGSAYPVGLGLGTALAGLIFAGMRRHRFMTLSEEVSARYDGHRGVVEFANLTLFFSQLCWLTVQIMGGASVLAAVTTLPPAWCVVAAGLVTAGIAIPGGFKSVVYTDFLQAIILLSGFGVVTWSALGHSGGLAGLARDVPASYFSFFGAASYGGWKIAGLVVALALSVLADPGRRLSMYSARSEAGARGSMAAAGVIVIGFSAVVGITGMYAYHLNPGLADPDAALLWLVMHVLPAWLAAFVVVSVASGIFSCANGNAMAVGTYFVRHIFQLATGRNPRRPLLAARVALVCAFVLCTTIALHAGTIVGFVLKFLPVTMSGLAVVLLAGRFSRRANWQGALAALIVTPVLSVALMVFLPAGAQAWNNAVVPAVAGLLALAGVSAVTPPPARSVAEMAGRLAAERSGIEDEPSAVNPLP